jgi:hypothetical protein
MSLRDNLQPKIYNIAERRNFTPNITATDYESFAFNKGIPIVIDNGKFYSALHKRYILFKVKGFME